MILGIIKSLCERKGITITELERVLGFGNGTLHKWGRGGASAENVIRVAEFFDVSVDCLLGRGSKLPTQEAKELAEEFDALTGRQKELVRCYVSIVKTGSDSSFEEKG